MKLGKQLATVYTHIGGEEGETALTSMCCVCVCIFVAPISCGQALAGSFILGYKR